MIMERIADFLKQLLVHHDYLKESTTAMSTDLKSILAKLDKQGFDIAAQGKQIDQMIAQRDAREQADLEEIDSLLDANTAASAANAAKLLGALAPADEGQAEAPPATSTVIIAAPTTAPAGVITITGDVPAIGSAVSGPGVTTGATVTDAVAGPADGQATITLDQPTEADHAGGESLTVVPPTS